MKRGLIILGAVTLLWICFALRCNRRDTTSIEEEKTWTISPYDALMQSVAKGTNVDWRLLAAMAWHESRFRPDARSRSGARGLMQVMPAVARGYKVSPESLFDPETSIRLSVRILDDIYKELRLPASTPREDKFYLTLACYNGGIGHVGDARRLARRYGESANVWSVVAKYLTGLSEPVYYEDQVVRHGRWTGAGQTRAYVTEVMRTYAEYVRKTSVEESPEVKSKFPVPWISMGSERENPNFS